MNIRKILYITLVITWMIIVFNFSGQQGTGSSNTSKKVTTFIVNVLDVGKHMNEDTKQEIVQNLEPFIRKLAHYTIYIIGGILLANLANAYGLVTKKVVYTSGIIGVIYAASDEIHQLFINGRSGKIEDVIIDSIGIFTGIAIYMLIKKTVDTVKSKVETSKRGRV